jgi:hypothetical protein
MKNKLLILALFLSSITIYANLPPTGSKGAGESTFSTTFNTDYDTIPLTRNGATITIGTIPASKGGTGVTATPTNGQLLIGDGAGFTLSTLSGTANQVIVSNGVGAITLSTPQDIATSSSPSFTSMTIADDITLSAAQFNNIEIGHQLAHTINTGVEGGGIISIDSDPAKFDITASNLTFSDYTANSDAPIVKEVDCSAFDAQTVTNLASADISYILIDDTCALTQQATYPTPQERRLKAFLGRVSHPTRTSITSVISSPDFLPAPISQVYDLIDAIGAFNITGNIISANGANLSLNKTSGILFRRSSNLATDDQNPHEVTTGTLTLAQFFRSTQTAVGSTLFTTLDVANYDNAGTVTAVGGGTNSSTNQRVYLGATNRIAVQYGQVVYSSLSAAIAGIPNESFIINPTLQENGTLLAVISCVKGATDLTNSSQCQISKVSRFDTSGITAGTGGTTNLQQAYNNSVTPQVTTSTAGGSIDLRRGSAADTDNVLTVQNGAGSGVVTIKGNGNTSVSGNLAVLGTTTLSTGLTGPLKSSSGVVSASSIVLTSEVTGTLPVANGGTGLATVTANGVVIGNGTSPLTTVAPGADRNVLRSNGTSFVATAPESFLGEPQYSAAVSITGTVTNEKNTLGTTADWISGNCTDANPSVCTLSGFSFVPNCSGNAQSTADRWIAVDNTSNTTLSVYQRDGTGALARTAFKIKCHGD